MLAAPHDTAVHVFVEIGHLKTEYCVPFAVSDPQTKEALATIDANGSEYRNKVGQTATAPRRGHGVPREDHEEGKGVVDPQLDLPPAGRVGDSDDGAPVGAELQIGITGIQGGPTDETG